jgi:hypothetical protein
LTGPGTGASGCGAGLTGFWTGQRPPLPWSASIDVGFGFVIIFFFEGVTVGKIPPAIFIYIYIYIKDVTNVQGVQRSKRKEKKKRRRKKKKSNLRYLSHTNHLKS